MAREPSSCSFSKKAKQRELRAFLVEHGDGLPGSVIRESTVGRDLNRWVTFCDGGRIIAAMRYAPTDWYLCTLKNAAVLPSHRGKGIGSHLYKKTAEKALADGRCLVLAADVTSDNVPSIRALKRVGFESVNNFCWAKGEKPADILHFVKMKPTRGECG